MVSRTQSSQDRGLVVDTSATSTHSTSTSYKSVARTDALEIIGLSALLSVVVASFFAGYLLGEDGDGGMRYDFYHVHWPIIERFSTTKWVTAIANYKNSATNPLLYMIASLLPLHGSQKIYHVITFTVGLLTWPLLSWAYYRRYSKFGINWLWASFGASAILISPTFRSSTFWGDTDWLPFAFCAGTSLLLSRFQDADFDKARAIGPLTLAALAAISSCAFYTRQYYAFLPVFAAWSVLTRTETSPFLIVSVFVLAMLPELFLVYLWKGVNPPSLHGAFHPALINIWKTGEIIGLLSLPMVVGCVRRSLGDALSEWWGARSTIIALAGLPAFIVTIMVLAAPEWLERGWGGGGGGIIVKAGVMMGAFGTPFILSVSYFGLVAAISFSMRSMTNAVLAAAYLAPFFVAVPTYQRYLEPSLVVAMFLFADTQTARTIFNRRVLMCNFLFSTFILGVGIIYYDFVLSVTSLPTN